MQPQAKRAQLGDKGIGSRTEERVLEHLDKLDTSFVCLCVRGWEGFQTSRDPAETPRLARTSQVRGPLPQIPF